MKLNNLSKLVISLTGPIAIINVLLIAVLVIVVPYLYVRRKVKSANSEEWNNIRTPLLIALIPFTMIGYLWPAQMAAFGGGNYSSAIFKTVFILLLSLSIFGFGLWYKGKFSFKFLKMFFIGVLIAILICAAIVIVSIFGIELLMRTDPAYREILHKLSKRVHEPFVQ